MSYRLMQAVSTMRQEIAYLKRRLGALEERLDRLIQSVPADDAAQHSVRVAPDSQPGLSAAISQAARPVRTENDVESNLGKFWLNKIGIIVFALGISFLLAYTFKYFGPLMKVLLGYCVACVFFLAGGRLERKEPFVNYGRVLLGGAWAIVYFTTYAMHHFEASRILESELADLCLLGAVAAGIIAHSLKYRSEELSLMALGLAYLTATVGGITYFTLTSVFLLGCAALFLVWRMQWVKVLVCGVAFTYAAHLVWVFKHIGHTFIPPGKFDAALVCFFLNTGFLILYWLLFSTGVHLVRAEARDTQRSLAAAHFINFALFFILTYPKFTIFYPREKSLFIGLLLVAYLGYALVSERAKKEALSKVNLTVAVFLLTLAVALRARAYHAVVFWQIELCALFLLGVLLERRILRILALALGVFVWVRITMAPEYGWLVFGDWRMSWEHLFWWGGVCSGSICYGIYRWAQRTKRIPADEAAAYNLFSLGAVYYLTILLFDGVSAPLVSLALCAETLALSLAGFALRDIFLIRYAAVVFFLAAGCFWFLDDFRVLSAKIQRLLSAEFVGVSLSVYYLYTQARVRLLGLRPTGGMPIVLFITAMISALVAVFKVVPEAWVSLALGATGALLFCAGFIAADKTFRVGGFVIFALTLLRVFIIDLSELALIYKIVSFIVVGLLFLGVSFVYTKKVGSS